MCVFCFAANLKRYTFLDLPATERFDAYLLSADYVADHAELAVQVREQDRELVADNGNVDLLRELAQRFGPAAAPLDAARKAWEAEHGRYARPGELPAELTAAFAGLAREVAKAVRARANAAHTRRAVARQTSMAPTFLVGMEDLTLGTLAAINVEPEYAALPRSFYEARVRRALRWATRTEQGTYGEVSSQVLAGLQAIDLDTAILAGRLAAEAGLRGVSVGLFGALTDRSHVDFRVQDGELVELPRTIPRPYLRVIELAAGILEGYRRAGRPRPAFHALGAGTPILLPLLALLGDGERYFATDSTSPILDGWASPTISLYVDDPAPLKYKAHKIADDWLRGGRGWDCQCRHCAAFHERHPPELGAARRWWRAAGRPTITKDMLERDGPLSPHLPLLSHAADDDLRRRAGLARVKHNHALLQALERRIRDESRRWSGLLAWVDEVVRAYVAASTSPGWSAAVTEAHALARSLGAKRHSA